MFFSRMLAAVLIANFLCLAMLNLARPPARALLGAYPAALVASWWLLRPARVRKSAARPGRAMWGLGLCCLLLLTVPRLGYLLEWIPGNAVLAQADDHGRLAELVSMTLSERYPLAHPGNQSYLLSHYYAAWFPMAFLKFAAPFLTLKDAIVAGNFLYHVLIVLSLMEMAVRLFPASRGLLFLFLMTWFGGLDWMFYWRVPFAHAEHWPRDVFGVVREISSFYTVWFWTVHHGVALMAVLLSLLLARQCRYREPWRKPLLAGLLLGSALYSSLFVLLSLPLVAGKELLWLGRRLWRTRALWVVGALALAPAFLMFGRLEGPPFRWYPAPPAYLALACAVDLAGIPLLLIWRWRHLGRHERRWLTGALVFLATTAAIESVGYNNYCMRGLLLPQAVFYGLLVRQVPAAWLRARRVMLTAAVVLAFSTVREAAWLTYQPLANSVWYWSVRGKAPPASIAARLRPEYARLAREGTVREYRPDARDRRGLTKYNSEKLVRDLPWEEMDAGERELARRPLRGPLW